MNQTVKSAYAFSVSRTVCAALAVFILTIPSVGVPAEAAIRWNADAGQAIVRNGRLELVIETKAGVNAQRLRDVQGQVYADRDYFWHGGRFPKLSKSPVTSGQGRSITFEGQLGSLTVEQSFTAPADEAGVILEQITIRNLTGEPVNSADFQCGFAKHVRDGDVWSPEAGELQLCPVPYRRDTDGQLKELPLKEIASRQSSYQGWAEPAHPTSAWGAEAWVWSKPGTTLLVAKHNAEGMEWSLIEPIKRGTETVARFGGAGQWKHGLPEGASRLAPGESFRFGETRFELVNGDWKQAYYRYRQYVESKGCHTPRGYNPPVHWNELFDNSYFSQVCELCFKPDFEAKNEKLLKEAYTLDMMKAEAAKAKELGCEALYLDPGWDTGPSHHIWGTDRLGSMASFADMLRKTYGLRLSLWISLAGVPPTYADPKACPMEARVVNAAGQRTDVHCVASPAFLKTKEERLLALCTNGVAFFMFDSTQYSGPCYDKSHGHQIPSGREEHAKALFHLAQRIKTEYPQTLIELHDPVTGPASLHYTPTYFGYAPPKSFDCLWGHEFMWNSMDDLLSRRAVSLYYYNLAYSIPLYLHVNLKQDNTNSMMFWWYASTCRHLGVGGKPSDPAIWAAHKRAMQTYLSLKRFYTQGTFYGLDEMVHCHTLADLRESVIDCFNLESVPAQKEIRFHPRDIGLPTGQVQIDGAPFDRKGDEIILKVPVVAGGHQLLKVSVRGAPSGKTVRAE